MTTKHTSGPWVADDNYQEHGHKTRIALPDKFGVPGATIAEAHHDWEGERTSWAEAEANARLIAAAPDMLEALKKFASWDQCWPGNINLEGVCELGRAAIAKAEGRDMNRRTRNE